jgi:hypothetical protein
MIFSEQEYRILNKDTSYIQYRGKVGKTGIRGKMGRGLEPPFPIVREQKSLYKKYAFS